MPNDSFIDCIKEAIKCHHNEIANYFKNNFNFQKNENFDDESIVDFIFRYCNYSYFPDDFKQNNVFYYLCRYNYSTLVNLFIDENKNDIESKIIQKHNVFFFNDVLYINWFLNGIPQKIFGKWNSKYFLLNTIFNQFLFLYSIIKKICKRKSLRDYLLFVVEGKSDTWWLF